MATFCYVFLYYFVLEALPIQFDEIVAISVDILVTSLNEIALYPINNIKIPDQTTKGNHMASLALDIVTYLTNNKYYKDKCSKIVEHLSTIMYVTNFGQLQSRESMWHKIIADNENRSITILVIHYWRSQNIHTLLKMVCGFTYVRELKKKSFLEM